jgi:hypothetical protein
MADRSRDNAPDPLGKRALFWVPSDRDGGAPGATVGSTIALPVGKRALFSGARAEPDSLLATSGNPLADRGSFAVLCERCNQSSHVGVLDLLIFQFPLGVWLPRGRFDHRMTCPVCRKRAWCSVTLRRD